MSVETALLNPQKTVRELAVTIPNATRVFEKARIDYCCGGDKSLSEACAIAGIDLEVLEDMFREKVGTGTDGVIDFQSLTLTDLIGHILAKHHVYTREEMTRLQALIAKVVSAHGANHLELQSIARVFDQLCGELTPHMFKEERVLFPYIEMLEEDLAQNRPGPHAPFGTVNNPIRMMMIEHDTAGDLLRKLRTLSSNYAVPADGCLSYVTLYQALDAFEQDLHQHIHLENNILFPRATELENKFVAAST